MNAKTELLLYRMDWLVAKVMRPTFRSMDESFEGWAYANGLLSQIHRLEARGFLESTLDSKTGKRLYRLTEAGRRAAAGPRDPETAWATPWDGKWRLFLFDIPETHRSKRRELTRALTGAGCGCLQASVWIAPQVPPAIAKLVDHDDPECSRLMMLLAESKGKRTDRNMVKTAWNFEVINRGYHNHSEILEEIKGLRKSATREDLAAWTEREHRAWRQALVLDPLLPDELLPKGYSGKEALKLRREALSAASEIIARIWSSTTA